MTELKEDAETASLRAPRLSAALLPRMASLLEDDRLLHQLVDGFGSPLNVVIPRQVLDNLDALTAPPRREGLTHRLFMAHKANRSTALVRAAAITENGLDVASSGELRSALGAGFTGARLEATGPKAPDFLCLALQHGVLLNVDSLAELDEAAALSGMLRIRPRPAVVLRMAGFAAHGSAPTRFGVPLAMADQALERCSALDDRLELRGFAFHLTSPSPQLRLEAAAELVHLLEEAQSRGLPARVLNVGGGFRVNFLRSAEEWAGFVHSLESSLLDRGPAVTWRGHAYGLRAESGVLRGRSQLPEFFRSDDAASELTAFLGATVPGTTVSMAELLRDNEIELHLEPGRACVDQAGLTLGRVASVSERQGHRHAVVEMNRSNLSSSDREFLVDPVLLARRGGSTEPSSPPCAAFLLGNLCLPEDLISRRLVSFPRTPAVGDVLAFPNTAGYFMDFTESETLLQRTAAKVAVDPSVEGWAWQRDDAFDPLRLLSAEP